MFNYILLLLYLIKKIVCWLAVGATKESKIKIGINGWEDWGSWGSGGDKEGGKGGGEQEKCEHNRGGRIKGSGRYKGSGEDDENGRENGSGRKNGSGFNTENWRTWGRWGGWGGFISHKNGGRRWRPQRPHTWTCLLSKLSNWFMSL